MQMPVGSANHGPSPTDIINSFLTAQPRSICVPEPDLRQPDDSSCKETKVQPSSSPRRRAPPPRALGGRLPKAALRVSRAPGSPSLFEWRRLRAWLRQPPYRRRVQCLPVGWHGPDPLWRRPTDRDACVGTPGTDIPATLWG